MHDSQRPGTDGVNEQRDVEHEEPFAVRAGAVLFWLVLLALPLLLAAICCLMLLFDTGFGRTSARLAFLATALLVLPMAGLSAFLSERGDPGNRLRCGALTVVIGVVALALAGQVAALAYPDYPFRGPHELLASLFALPGVVAPIAYLWRRWGTLHRRFVVAVGVATAMAAGLAYYSIGGVHDIDRKLPITATHIHRFRYEMIMPADSYDYYVRADISEQQFRDYVRDLGLKNGETVDEFLCVPQPFHEHSWPRPKGNIQTWSRSKTGPAALQPEGSDARVDCGTHAAYVDGTAYACHVCRW